VADFDYYRTFIKEALEQLEIYLLSDQVYWPVNILTPAGQPSYPKLTAGNMLYFLACLTTQAATPTQQTKVQQLKSRLYALTTHWHSAWQTKIAQEYASRLRQWTNYLNELDNDPEKHADFYHTEVRLRLLLELLKQETEMELEDLASVDALLKKYFEKGEFIWEDSEAAAFPSQLYWFLYGSVKEAD
jgi:hypothetical protein